MPRLNFNPSRHGFHFANNFTNHVGPFTTRGLCGGCALAVFNYYRHGLPVPTHKPASFGTADGVPPEGQQFRSYIYGLQIASFASAAGFFFPNWPWEDPLIKGYRASLADFERVRRAIDGGRFPLLGLRSSTPGNLNGHQVLAYGYDADPPRLYLCDSNYPDEEMTLELDAGTERVVHKHSDGRPSADAASYASYFIQLELNPNVTDLFTEPQRPTYADLVVLQGIKVSEPVGDGLRQVGERLEVSAVVRNVGDYPAHVSQFVLWARDPRGRNRDSDLGAADRTTQLAPGAEITLRRNVTRFGEEPGDYHFGVSYLSEQGHWLVLPLDSLRGEAVKTVTLVPGADGRVVGGTGGYRGPGTYTVRARHSGKVLDVTYGPFTVGANGQPLIQYDSHSGDNQKFIVEPLPEGWVRFRAKHSGKSLDVEGVSRAPGARLWQWDTLSAENQQFKIEPVGDYYRICARHSGLFFDVAGASRDNNAAIVQYPWTGGDNQLFQFEHVS
jgi:hypothetical protein